MARNIGKPMKITVVSLQTFGDYLLKAPFFHQLFALYPDAEITVITEPRGSMLYPLLDARLRLVVLRKEEFKLKVFARMVCVPRADLVYVLDTRPQSYLLALLLRAQKKYGWRQSVSRLFQGPQTGFGDVLSVPARLDWIVRKMLRFTLLRTPETDYEGYVELGLLDAAERLPELANYRGTHSYCPPRVHARPYLLCATQASWIARQLDAATWAQIVGSLLEQLPDHDLILDCDDALLAQLPASGRIVRMERRKTLHELFSYAAHADAIVCSDSFLTHLASWFSVPAVSFFGPASPHRFRPTAPGSSILFHAPACSPCRQQGKQRPCLAGHSQCISFQQISAEEVVQVVHRALTGSRSTEPSAAI